MSRDWRVNLSEHKHDPSGGQNIGVAFALNLGFALLEFAGGVLTNSVAILSDALHDFGDSLSLGLAWLLMRFSRRRADARFSFGYRRFSLLGALITSVVLVFGSMVVLTEAIKRLQSPEPFDARGLIIFAVIGIAINGFAAIRLRRDDTLNERVISWHLIEDVLGWVAVLVMGILALFVDIPILDPLLSIGITLFVLFNVVRNVWSTLRVFLQAVPSEIDLKDIEAKLRAVADVQSVHSLRVWSLDGEYNVLSAHLVVKMGSDFNAESMRRITTQSAQVLADVHVDEFTFQLDTAASDAAEHDPLGSTDTAQKSSP